MERGLTDEHLLQAKRGYLAMVSEVDHHIGVVLDHLDAVGMTDRTTVVFTSDHGEFLGEHLRWGKSYPVPDCVSRVPLIFAGAGVERRGEIERDIVEAIDIVPTLLAIGGLPLPPQLEGTSRFAMLQGEASDTGPGDALTEDASFKTLRTQTHRYILHADGREELFDLPAEFGEYRDIAPLESSRNTLAALRHRLLQRLFAKERPLPRTWPY